MFNSKICPHFNNCGGCDLQNHEYSEQLLLKQDELLRIFDKNIVVYPSKKQFHYRSRMDFICSEKGLGLRSKRKSKNIIPIVSCLLMSEHANKLFKTINSELKQSGLSVYNLHSKKGFLRYVTIREAQSTGELMLIFTTNSPILDEEKSFLKLLKTLSSKVKSTYWFVHNDVTDEAVMGEMRLLIGKPEIYETLFNNSFAIKPKTFFQSNLLVAEKIFSEIKKNVSGSVLDLFCGVGVIAISVFDNSNKIVGVEKNVESILVAKINAKNNDKKIDFLSLDAFTFIRDSIKKKVSYDTIIVDPPRTGLGSDIIMGLKALNPKKIIYMSCNPKTLRNDLKLLSSYKLVSLNAYDMFPQTNHVECLAVLKQ